MPGKYIFYDLETTGKGKKESANSFGTTPKWEQILQIAAIVVDENFLAGGLGFSRLRQRS